MLRSLLALVQQEGGPPTQWDMFRAFAALTLTLELAGRFLFPESDGLRAFGSLFMPLWLLTEGFRMGRGDGVDERPYYAATIWLLLICLVQNGNILPFALPLTILICHKLLAQDKFRELADKYPLFITLILAALGLPTLYLVEFGLFTMMFALVSYWTVKGNDSAQVRISALAAAAIYGTQQVVYLQLGPVWEWIVYLSVGAATLFAMEFSEKPWGWLSAHPQAKDVLLILTRHTLYYYVMLFTVFSVISRYLHPTDKTWHFSFF